jgi:hypothetical protein
MFRMRIQYWLYTEMHYSLWNDMDTFRGYWLHVNILREDPRWRAPTQRTDLKIVHPTVSRMQTLTITIYNYCLYCKI